MQDSMYHLEVLVFLKSVLLAVFMILDDIVN